MKFITLLTAFLFSFSAEAKDLTHRLGVGFKNNTVLDLPSLAAVYYPNSDYAFTLGLGLDTQTDHSAYQVSAGARSVIYSENNLNFFAAAQLAVLGYENSVDGKQNGVELAATLGAEFFLAGLENLGFTFEAGVALDTPKNSRFRTLGLDPFRAGLIFYF